MFKKILMIHNDTLFFGYENRFLSDEPSYLKFILRFAIKLNLDNSLSPCIIVSSARLSSVPSLQNTALSILKGLEPLYASSQGTGQHITACIDGFLHQIEARPGFLATLREKINRIFVYDENDQLLVGFKSPQLEQFLQDPIFNDPRENQPHPSSNNALPYLHEVKNPPFLFFPHSLLCTALKLAGHSDDAINKIITASKPFYYQAANTTQGSPTLFSPTSAIQQPGSDGYSRVANDEGVDTDCFNNCLI